MQQDPLLPDVEPKPVIDFEHAKARRVFEHALRDLPFGDVYATMCSRGFRWREAAFVAWAIQTKEARQPNTKSELANLLGCSPDKITSMEKDKRLTAMRLRFAQLAYVDALPDIIDASIQVASNPSYKSTPERNNVINKVLGIGQERLDITVGQGQAENYEELSDEELAALAGEELRADDD